MNKMLLRIIILVLVLSGALTISPAPYTRAAAGAEAKLTITLPTSDIFDPSAFKVTINRTTYTYTFTPPRWSPSQPQGTTITNILTDSSSTPHYVVTLTITDPQIAYNMKRNMALAQSPPPASNAFILNLLNKKVAYPFELTFKNTQITQTQISTLYTKVNSGSVSGTSLGDASCQNGYSSYICFSTLVDFVYKDNETNNTNNEAYTKNLKSKISIKGINIEGNVASGGDVSGFNLSSDALAVGSSVPPDLDQGQKVESYTSFNWSKVTQYLNLDKMDSAKATDMTNATSNSWYLNSSDPSGNIASSDQTSASSPPEGKFWYYNDNLDISQDTTFNGRGTVLINGNLTVSKKLSCATGSQIAIVANSIYFNEGSGTSCGLYIAKDRDLNFSGITSGGDFTGIFVAQNKIQLPYADSLSGPLNISVDTAYRVNPTIFMSELLTAVFSEAR